MNLLKNDFFQLDIINSTSIHITVFKKGYTLLNFNKVLEGFPRVSLTSFANLKKAMDEATNESCNIGDYLPLITCSISKDKMKASIKILATNQEFEELKPSLSEAILHILEKNEVSNGFLMDVIEGELLPRKEIIVAVGIEPIHGNDAIVHYFQLSERKPVIEESGKADFYNMNFIDEVDIGAWLGEKIPPTDGTNGKNILGEDLKAKKGKDKRVIYDASSIELIDENEKQVLRAKIKGVVSKSSGKISIANHLLIEGDVGIRTGNIEFDGSITIKGTVHEGFSAVAMMDIAILSELGVRKVSRIESLHGDVYIKGGVFGDGVIKAQKNIYVKHANECCLEAGEDIHIGFYSTGSNLSAKNVITEENKGKIIGGHIVAKGRVFATEIGNKAERKTIIQVEGFERSKIKEELEELFENYKEAVLCYKEIQHHLEVFENLSKNLNDAQQEQYTKLLLAHDLKLKEVNILNDKKKTLEKMLSIKGEGEISVLQGAYPETTIEIKNRKKKLKSMTKGTFYTVGREMKHE
ncbi:FapA family protein [Metabacillus litoralis]|uniref:FapA family protein n=1 Tax=Metabacillus litoralis TaxID=152268 RepID=UPI001CFE628E|nr:FapA family protein [Metabacillus litoralis]